MKLEIEVEEGKTDFILELLDHFSFVTVERIDGQVQSDGFSDKKFLEMMRRRVEDIKSVNTGIASIEEPAGEGRVEGRDMTGQAAQRPSFFARNIDNMQGETKTD